MTDVATCPVDHGRDDRKSAALAAANSRPAAGSIHIKRFGELRSLFRSPEAVQGMPGAKVFGSGSNPDHMPVFFLDGEAHKHRRQAIAQYFTPKASRHRSRHQDEPRACPAIAPASALQRAGW